MLQRSARYIVAALLVAVLCPAMAFAADDQRDSSPSNPLEQLLYMVVGYDNAQVDEGKGAEASSSNLYPDSLSTSGLSVTPSTLNGGLLLGAGGSLYYFPEVKTDTDSGFDFTYHQVFCYNVSSKSWKEIASLPAQVKWCSAAVFDGKIVVCAASLDEATENVFTYDTRVEEANRAWDKASAEGVPVGAGIVNRGGLLMIAGGASGGSLGTGVYEYEIASGRAAAIGQLAYGAVAPKMVPHGKSVYVYSWGSSLEEVKAGTGSPHFQEITGGTVTALVSALPATASVPSGVQCASTQAAMFGGISSSAVDGVTLAGPLASSETEDTFIMKWDNKTFADYGMRASAKRLYGAVSFVYLGKLYTLGANLDDTGAGSLSFRSTDCLDGAILSGDNGVWRKGSGQNLSFVCSPDYGRFFGLVEVDGSRLVFGTDYSASSGSTLVTLSADFLQRLDVGTHSITVYFDDQLTQVKGSFKVEVAADAIAEGYTKPTALAKTGDAVPATPFVAGALCVFATAVLAYRRSARSR